MAEPREPSHPPSDPYPSLSRPGPGNVSPQRPARAPLVVATVLGLALLASGLVLWRRPRSSSDGASGDAPESAGGSSTGSGLEDASAQAKVDANHLPATVVLSDARVVGCHDRGPRKTPPEDCDRLVGIERALSHAIEQAASCVPPSLPSATIEYVADVSFSRRTLRISLPRAARSVRDRKVVGACTAAVREGVAASSLDGVGHEHARYRISITATYRSPG
jgi:hypothetical protein